MYIYTYSHSHIYTHIFTCIYTHIHMYIHIFRISTGEKRNPKPNPIGFGTPNPKTIGEKSSSNPNPPEPKSADIRPETAQLPSLTEGVYYCNQCYF